MNIIKFTCFHNVTLTTENLEVKYKNFDKFPLKTGFATKQKPKYFVLLS